MSPSPGPPWHHGCPSIVRDGETEAVVSGAGGVGGEVGRVEHVLGSQVGVACTQPSHITHSVLKVRVLVGAFNQEKALICDCDIFAKVRFNIYWGGPFSAFYNSVINSSIITRVLLKNIVYL